MNKKFESKHKELNKYRNAQQPPRELQFMRSMRSNRKRCIKVKMQPKIHIKKEKDRLHTLHMDSITGSVYTMEKTKKSSFVPEMCISALHFFIWKEKKVSLSLSHPHTLT